MDGGGGVSSSSSTLSGEAAVEVEKGILLFEFFRYEGRETRTENDIYMLQNDEHFERTRGCHLVELIITQRPLKQQTGGPRAKGYFQSQIHPFVSR